LIITPLSWLAGYQRWLRYDIAITLAADDERVGWLAAIIVTPLRCCLLMITMKSDADSERHRYYATAARYVTCDIAI